MWDGAQKTLSLSQPSVSLYTKERNAFSCKLMVVG